MGNSRRSLFRRPRGSTARSCAVGGPVGPRDALDNVPRRAPRERHRASVPRRTYGRPRAPAEHRQLAVRARHKDMRVPQLQRRGLRSSRARTVTSSGGAPQGRLYTRVLPSGANRPSIRSLPRRKVTPRRAPLGRRLAARVRQKGRGVRSPQEPAGTAESLLCLRRRRNALSRPARPGAHDPKAASSAKATSPADWKRSSGFFSRHGATTGRGRRDART